ncbi:conjugal transfer protein TraI [Dyadobacter pollutisoli]|uniref:Conjugal transfer protein TraI n=1 Tax=Dyadobacter pollutisoli TaxID=2910158 RepID=A0A9E8NFC4_9BACT|nr:conjugal transfer protein TraI [Dyadobacter pollutisoli]WAC13257.1 conjugal transfer protein TraI [Dyadobacter pollutisoli]
MRRKVFMIVFFIFTATTPVKQAEAAIPWAQIIKEAVKRVVRAFDLLVQRRQNRQIRLQNAQKALENTMAKLKLDEIEDWVKKQRDLYEQYYQELKKVKAVVSYYFRVKAIADKQIQILRAYQSAWALFRNDAHFTAIERGHMQTVYQGMLAETARSVELLELVVKSFTTQMSDVKRLEIIDQAADRTDQILDELNAFSHENKLLSLSRAKNEVDAKVVKELYGIP